MQADISLIIHLQEKRFADPRRIALLKEVRNTGSISQGAKLAGISYKSAWDAINEMNQLSDQPLVNRATGGKGGGGAMLTPRGERLIQLFELLGQVQQRAFDALQDDAIPLDSLLGAISRFSLQTSARNQFYGTLLTRQLGSVQQHIRVQLADGVTEIQAALTARSADRLQLHTGQEVLLLIKAPWIKLDNQPSEAENQLAVTVTGLEPGPEHAEVLLQTQGGEILCATVPNAQLAQQNLQPGSQTLAHFRADEVIIATLL